MDLDPRQIEAINLLQQMRLGRHDEIVIDGPAGTGKSTVIGEFMEGGHETIVAAPTHKACDVLRRKGVHDARTIHSLMYQMVNEYEEQPQFDPETGEPVLDEETGEQVVEKIVIGQAWRPREEAIREPVVFEERSMIGARMTEDIRNWTDRRAFVGDPFQLPPVKDEDTRLVADVELDHVWRIDDSPPLALATAIRTRQPAYPHLFDIPVLPRVTDTWDRAAHVEGSIVIVWKNVTRHLINSTIRGLRGCTNWVPIEGDRVVFYETDLELGVYNGLGAVVDKVLAADKFNVHLRVITDGGEFRTLTARSGPFRGEKVENRGRRDPDDPIHLEYAYAITCHKAQGSEWPEVFVVDDVREQAGRFGAEQARRWLYTAVTRTTENLNIVR